MITATASTDNLFSNVRNVIESEVKRMEDLHRREILGAARLLAHDLRAPIGVLEILKEQVSFERPESQKLYALAIDRLNDLVGRLINCQARRGTLISIKTALHNALDLVRGSNQGKDLMIEFTMEEDEQLDKNTVIGLSRILTNLVQNSIDSYEQSSRKDVYVRVYVQGSKLGKALEVRVIDHGSGMSEATIEKALGGGFTNKRSGNGLGLSQAKSWVENLKGSLEVTSHEGFGTQVQICFPISVAEIDLPTTHLDS